MTPRLNRRTFLSAGAASLATLSIGAAPVKEPGSRRPMVISSGSTKAVEIAMKMVKEGADPLDAAIAGVAVVEADPNDHSVGLGGTPNEDGVVQLDAAVMHGPTHGAAGVAALEGIVHPAAVARLVMKRTKHVLLVGPGAKKFALDHGFPEADLLTEETRKAWIQWKEDRFRDSRLAEEVALLSPEVRAINDRPTHGTIHVSVLDTHGDLACVTSTSGLAYKVPGRVGDSPIIGAGLYLDNTVGSCGSVGLGEVNLVNCASFLLIENIRNGMDPKAAMAAVFKRIKETTPRDRRFRGADGNPPGVNFYSLTKDGRVAAANMGRPVHVAVHDGDRVRIVESETIVV